MDLFWTGSKVISTDYTEEDLELATKLLGRKPFIWDNYPVNDGKKASDYIYLQPFTNRQNLIRFCSGIAVNPMKQTFLNLIPLANITRAILNLNDCNKQYEKLENNFSDSVLKRYPDLLKSFIIKYHDLSSKKNRDFIASKYKYIRKNLAGNILYGKLYRKTGFRRKHQPGSA